MYYSHVGTFRLFCNFFHHDDKGTDRPKHILHYEILVLLDRYSHLGKTFWSTASEGCCRSWHIPCHMWHKLALQDTPSLKYQNLLLLISNAVTITFVHYMSIAGENRQGVGSLEETRLIKQTYEYNKHTHTHIIIIPAFFLVSMKRKSALQALIVRLENAKSIPMIPYDVKAVWTTSTVGKRVSF